MKLVVLFYRIKSIVPRRLQIFLRRAIASHKRKKHKETWPINPKAAVAPDGWKGWPEKKKFAIVLTHDVETAAGQDKCIELMNLEKQLGFRSSFNFVLEDYRVSDELRLRLEEEGFEVGIHGLKHDGKLFQSREIFEERAPLINHYLKVWKAAGFRAPCVFHNLEWIADLDIEYDSSTFDTDPFEPQPEGLETIYPLWITNSSHTRGYVELPYTLPQDHCLFVIWKEKLDWVAQNGGMALFNTHADYMNFERTPCSLEQYPVSYYRELLEYLTIRYKDQYWHVLPKELARFWKSSMISQHSLKDSKQSEATAPSTKIWIDLDNTPNVPFFLPIIQELKRRGHKVVLSARDAFQVCELADIKKLQYERIGRHYGKNKIMKLLGLLWRSVQLAPFYLRQKPGLGLSHGSRSLNLLCNLLRIPSVLVVDYEHLRTIPPILPRWSIVPEVLTGKVFYSKEKLTRYYRGIKEDVYVPEFKPDPSLFEDLGLCQNEIIITIRPPADEAHYHNPESDVLLFELMSRILQTPGIRVVLLPRNYGQKLAYKKSHPEWFTENKTVIPPQAVDALNLIWFSDLVISGGGTMNRESAALGVPVYSIFLGKTGAVDRMLEQEGLLTMIHSCEDVWTKIRFVKRDKNKIPDNKPRAALKDIVNHIEEIIRIEHVS